MYWHTGSSHSYQQNERLNMMKKKVEADNSRQELAFLFSLPFVFIGILLSIFVLLPLTLSFVFTTLSPPQPLVNYDPESVTEICETLNIESTNEFCSETHVQDRDTFRNLLETQFPSGNTTFETVTGLIEDWDPILSGCNNEIDYHVCPSPDMCNRGNSYMCRYSMSFTGANTLLRIRINRHTGVISRYEILEGGDS